ncbi:MAG TPA: VCBS repeat-containing protein, partial [Segetibacter sp.]|nr:VCBS repeat-containing protein [Segetibacter sp.]
MMGILEIINKGYLLFHIILALLLTSCNKDKKLFTLLSSDQTGITFSNDITENDSLNILDVENIYNGGGVGIGDFNNDGLQDIYFTANQVSNKLYLNKGDLHFDDITNAANVDGAGRWCRGVSVVDINNDGLLDMYISASLSKDSKKRENLLYINTGIDTKGYPHFKNMAAEYGLADTSHTTMAAFFDYDNNGDLDVYLLINEIVKGENPGAFRPVYKKREHPNT